MVETDIVAQVFYTDQQKLIATFGCSGCYLYQQGNNYVVTFKGKWRQDRSQLSCKALVSRKSMSYL